MRLHDDTLNEDINTSFLLHPRYLTFDPSCPPHCSTIALIEQHIALRYHCTVARHYSDRFHFNRKLPTTAAVAKPL